MSRNPQFIRIRRIQDQNDMTKLSNETFTPKDLNISEFARENDFANSITNNGRTINAAATLTPSLQNHPPTSSCKQPQNNIAATSF